MVVFDKLMDGYAVKVNGKLFGFISRATGFFIDDWIVNGMFAVSSEDLRDIATRAEVAQGFITCQRCNQK